jgi:hypothetical protein
MPEDGIPEESYRSPCLLRCRDWDDFKRRVYVMTSRWISEEPKDTTPGQFFEKGIIGFVRLEPMKRDTYRSMLLQAKTMDDVIDVLRQIEDDILMRVANCCTEVCPSPKPVQGPYGETVTLEPEEVKAEAERIKAQREAVKKKVRERKKAAPKTAGTPTETYESFVKKVEEIRQPTPDQRKAEELLIKAANSEHQAVKDYVDLGEALRLAGFPEDYKHAIDLIKDDESIHQDIIENIIFSRYGNIPGFYTNMTREQLTADFRKLVKQLTHQE